MKFKKKYFASSSNTAFNYLLINLKTKIDEHYIIDELKCFKYATIQLYTLMENDFHCLKYFHQIKAVNHFL